MEEAEHTAKNQSCTLAKVNYHGQLDNSRPLSGNELIALFISVVQLQVFGCLCKPNHFTVQLPVSFHATMEI